jgi:cell wall-associated NlpC family hydrolase
VDAALTRARAWLLGILAGFGVLGACLLGAAAVRGAGERTVRHTAPAQPQPRPRPADVPELPRSRPQLVEPEAGVVAPVVEPGARKARKARDSRPSNAQIRRELRRLQTLTAKAALPRGVAGRVAADGEAKPPADAPGVVRAVVRTGNVIARTPYLWGGGHGSWSAVGYDCSGSVSFALAGAGLLNAPLTSGSLAGWGAPGPGRWITIYANATHVFMVVAGMRFDTGGLRANGTRWQPGGRSTAGFTARHPPGL